VETSPYQKVFLRRGVVKRRDAEDRDELILEQAMEYTGAMGPILLDELAYVHKKTELGLGWGIWNCEVSITNVNNTVADH